MSVFFDLETRDLLSDPHFAGMSRSQQIKALTFGMAITFDDVSQEWRTWWPPDLPALWQYLCSAEEVIGWNIVDFDIPVVQANLRRSGRTIKKTEVVRPLDMFAVIRDKTDRWYSLQDVVSANLNAGKSADGKQAVKWLQAGDPQSLKLVEEYCRQDVQLLISLFKLLENGQRWILPARPQRGEPDELQLVIDGSTIVISPVGGYRIQPTKVGAPQSDTKSQAMQLDLPRSKPWYRKWWIWLIVLILFLGLCMMFSTPPA